MVRLAARLLGPLSVARENSEQVRFAYAKVAALCAFLAAEPDVPHSRSRLAAMFWPEKPESDARHGLSQALLSLRRSLGETDRSSPLIQGDRQSIRFCPDDECWIDLVTFRELVRQSRTDPSQDLLRQAAELYRGPFLDGLALSDCPDFEAWQRATQNEVERAHASILTSLAEVLSQHSEHLEAIDAAERLIDLDPWDESSQRLHMRVLDSAGHRSAALRQYEDFVQGLRLELDVDPEPETQALAQRIRSGATTPESPSPEVGKVVVASGTPHLLPSTTSTIIDREHEIEQITGDFERGESRLITLVGPGGIGKSRLAVEVAGSMRSRMQDGVFFVPLAGVHSAEFISPAILDAMVAEVDLRVDQDDQLLWYLQDRSVLLVLDNFEHLIDGAVLLTRLLDACPGLAILVTSRERLMLTSETVFEVEGLSLPDRSHPPTIATSGAARLFMMKARKHKAGFLPRTEDVPSIARISWLTGGMPLAIELAAAWIPVLTADEIADEIEQSLDFLRAELQDLPERHRSVGAVVGRSWEILTESEQRTFRRLSVFAGGFTRDAATYVAGASLPLLSSLVRKSLVRHTEDGRYVIHELLRQFAGHQLSELPDEAAVVRDRYRDYFMQFLATREQPLKGSNQVAALSEIAAEIENIRGAWQFSIDTGDDAGLWQAAHSLWLYCEITDRYREGMTLLTAARLKLSDDQEPQHGCRRRRSLTLARLMSREAGLSFRVAGPGSIQCLVNQALDTIEEFGEPAEEGLLLNFMACAAHLAGDYDDEQDYLIRSIEAFQHAGDDWGASYSRNDLGKLWTLRQRYHEARDLLRNSLKALERIGDRRGIAFALRNLGIVENHLGNTDHALELLRRSVDVRKPIGNQWGIAESLTQVGVILRDSDQHEEAAQHFREALEIARNIRAMQLATEIIGEYLPILELEHQQYGAQVSIARLAEVTRRNGSIDTTRVGELVDSLLDGVQDGTPAPSA